MRQRGRFAGYSIYASKDGNISKNCLCYKNGSQLPFLNVTEACVKSGRYIIIYNERLDAVTYPSGYELETVFMELCEVIVNGMTFGDLSV